MKNMGAMFVLWAALGVLAGCQDKKSEPVGKTEKSVEKSPAEGKTVKTAGQDTAADEKKTDQKTVVPSGPPSDPFGEDETPKPKGKPAVKTDGDVFGEEIKPLMPPKAGPPAAKTGEEEDPFGEKPAPKVKPAAKVAEEEDPFGDKPAPKVKPAKPDADEDMPEAKTKPAVKEKADDDVFGDEPKPAMKKEPAKKTETKTETKTESKTGPADKDDPFSSAPAGA